MNASQSFVFINLNVLDEPFYDFFVRCVIILNVFVEFLAQRQVLGLQLLFGFPPGMRMYPVLNPFDLVARCQINEFLDVGTVVVLDPFIGLHVHGFALGVRAMNGALVHVHALQVVNDDGAHAFNEAVILCKFQIVQRDVERFHEITQFNRVFALCVQKHLQVKLLIVCGVVVIYHHVSLLAQLYELRLQCFVLLHQLFHDLHHVEVGCR